MALYKLMINDDDDKWLFYSLYGYFLVHSEAGVTIRLR